MAGRLRITGDLLYLEWNVADTVNLNPYGHMALVDRNYFDLNGNTGAIDAHPDNPGRTVYRYVDADVLASKYRYASGHRMNIEYFRGNYGHNVYGWDYRNALSPMSSVRHEAVSAAIGWVGKRDYSPFTEKGADSATYCSLMVWAAYQEASRRLREQGYYKYHPWGWLRSLNIDLDSDGGYWVTPRDILRSAWVWGVFQVSDQRPQPGGDGGGSDATRWPVHAVAGR